jgi:nicotinamidase-related amidase
MSAAQFVPAKTALLIGDLQNDFLHPGGAYGRAGQGSAAIAALPARLKPLKDQLAARGVVTILTQFTIVHGRGGEPIISDHLGRLRPFLGRGDFAPGSWGQDVVEDLAPVDIRIEKVAFSAFYMSRLEWVLRKLGIGHLIVCGIVTNGGVASTVRDAHTRDFDVTLLTDGCAAFSEEVHATAIRALAPVCRLASIAEIMAETSGAAPT